MNKSDILIAHGDDARGLAYMVMDAARVCDMIGDISARIALKPNLVLASPADMGATTHPELCAGAIDYLHAHGYHNIVVMEGAWVGARTSDAFDVCGYRELAKRYGVDLIDTQKSAGADRDCAGMRLSVCKCVDDVDFLINMPVLKGHCQTRVTCALKNLKGLIPNAEKRRFHTMGLHKPIAHLGAGVKQHFVLVDAICGDLHFEEGGTPVPRGQVLGFLDPVLCDAFACEALGYETEDVGYIGIAERLGVGSADLKRANRIELNAPDGARGPLKASRRVATLTHYVDERQACSACYANLICALERLDDEGLLSRLVDQVAVGQGHKGETGALGVGECCAGFDVYARGCPPRTTDILAVLRS